MTPAGEVMDKRKEKKTDLVRRVWWCWCQCPRACPLVVSPPGDAVMKDGKIWGCPAPTHMEMLNLLHTARRLRDALQSVGDAGEDLLPREARELLDGPDVQALGREERS